MNKTVSIVVTYNRKKLLEENLYALLNQTYKNSDILVIDNNSTDGTEEMVRQINSDRIFYINTGKNVGGAGGFHIGVAEAIDRGYEYAWLMDDDTIPTVNSLESLIDKAKLLDNNFSFISSIVKWIDGSEHIMNKSQLIKKSEESSLIAGNSLVRAESCSFVACFINLKVAQEVGLPIKEFFIYGDDDEYTLRLSRALPAYLNLESVVIHKTKKNMGNNIDKVPEDSIDRQYYKYRNSLYNARKKGIAAVFNVLFEDIKDIVKIIIRAKNIKLKRIYILIRGSFSGIFFNPDIVKSYKKINGELQ